MNYTCYVFYRIFLLNQLEKTILKTNKPSIYVILQISFEKCSLRPRSTPEKTPSPPSPLESKVSAASPRRIIRAERTLRNELRNELRAELQNARRQSLDALLHDTGERVKEMFQGMFRYSASRESKTLKYMNT